MFYEALDCVAHGTRYDITSEQILTGLRLSGSDTDGYLVTRLFIGYSRQEAFDLFHAEMKGDSDV